MMTKQTLTNVGSDIYTGVGGLVLYLCQAKKYNFESKLQSLFYRSAVNMFTTDKELYWIEKNISPCMQACNDLKVLIELCKVFPDLNAMEKIKTLTNFINQNLKKEIEKNDIGVLQLAKILEIVIEVYTQTNDFVALKIMSEGGTHFKDIIKKEGYINAVSEKNLHIGDLLNALYGLSIVFEKEQEYRNLYEDITSDFIEGGVWKNPNTYLIWGKRLQIEEGTLLYIAESLFKIIDKREDEFSDGVRKFLDNIRKGIEKSKWKSDTLNGGLCTVICYALNIKDNQLAVKLGKELLNNFTLYHEIRVKEAPLYPEVGLGEGYLGVALTLVKLSRKLGKSI